MDFQKNRCSICMKLFCCSAHRSDHEVKNHSEMCPKLKEDFIHHMFQKRAKTIFLKSENRRANDIKEKQDNYINEKRSNISIPGVPKAPIKRLHNEINRQSLPTSVTVSETRRILIPVHKVQTNYHPNNKPLLKPNYQSFQGPQKSSPSHNNVKTSTPILGTLSNEKTSTSNWDSSPASSISYFGTPNMAGDCKSEGGPLYRPQSHKTLITPLRSIMAKNTKLLSDSDIGLSQNFNSSKGRRVTFSFSSSRVSSTHSSPLESVQEVEIHEEIQDENREIMESIKSFTDREMSSVVSAQENYVLEVTSTMNSHVHTSEWRDGNLTNMQRFSEDSLASVKGSLFSCLTSMFCSAIQTLPLWRGSDGENRLKRSRSPERGIENVVFKSPLPKRRCYPCDLRLNPIRARKPISKS